MTELVVLHDYGSVGGEPWRAAFAAWPAAVCAPDLPGHGREPDPPGGQYEVGDALFFLADRLVGWRDNPPLVVGVGRNGHTAQLLALAGRAAGLVLVNGLGGPWRTVSESSADLLAQRRALLTAAHHDHHDARVGTDPRADLVLGPRDRDVALASVSAITVPVLVIETPTSPTPDAPDLVAAIAAATAVDGTDDVGQIAAAVMAWWPTVTTR